MSVRLTLTGPHLLLDHCPPDASSFHLTFGGVNEPLDVCYVDDVHHIVVETVGIITRGTPGVLTFNGDADFLAENDARIDPFTIAVSNP